MEAATIPSGDRGLLSRSPLARLPDRALKYGLTGLAGLILVLIVYFFIRLVNEASPAFSHAGVFGFTFNSNNNHTYNAIYNKYIVCTNNRGNSYVKRYSSKTN